MAIMNFNYNQAIRQADQIDSAAGELLNTANRQLQTTLESVAACWNGDASAQFISYCRTVQEDIRREAGKLQDLARRIRQVARIIREAEERARELQRQREAAAAAAAAAAAEQKGNFSSGGGSFSGGGGGGSF
ncbi:MAG: hypothetical protein GX940_04950 [Clostridiaceae bacterium]|nr:hypothetical protein [Clostridiaceae bacterium]